MNFNTKNTEVAESVAESNAPEQDIAGFMQVLKTGLHGMREQIAEKTGSAVKAFVVSAPLLVGAAGEVEATPILVTFDLEADNNLGPVAAGDAFEMIIRFDSDAIDNSPHPSVSDLTITEGSIQGAGYDLTFDGGQFFASADDYLGSNFFFIDDSNGLVNQQVPVGGTAFSTFAFGGIDIDSSVTTSNLDFGADLSLFNNFFDYFDITDIYLDDGNEAQLDFNITNVDAKYDIDDSHNIAEPSTVAMIGIGLTGLALSMRRRNPKVAQDNNQALEM